MRMFLFLSYPFGTYMTNTFIHSPIVPSKTMPYSRSDQLVYTRFQPEKAHIPFGAAQTYLTCIREITNLQITGL